LAAPSFHGLIHHIHEWLIRHTKSVVGNRAKKKPKQEAFHSALLGRKGVASRSLVGFFNKEKDSQS
jgi:hypothetical protein